MYNVFFYRTKNGESPVSDYIDELLKKSDKDSRIKATKILNYIKLLETHGLALNSSYLKHLQEEIWELRPLRDRILFAAWYERSFVLLHYFVKKTQKTPKREIEKALRLLRDLQERGENFE